VLELVPMEEIVLSSLIVLRRVLCMICLDGRRVILEGVDHISQGERKNGDEWHTRVEAVRLPALPAARET